jgi:hypothetical protein
VSDYRTQIGDRIRDPYSGDVEVVGVLRAEDLGRFVTGSYRGSSAERCALHGAPLPKEMQRRDHPRPCPARDSRLKESA